MITSVVLLLAAQRTTIKPGLPKQTIILTYHDVIDRRDSKALWFDCTQRELEQQLDWLRRKGANFVTLNRLYYYLTEGRPLPKHPVVITFADNYRGFWDRAYPVLKARKIPVAMFVHTGFVGATNGRPKMTWSQLRQLQKEGLVTVCSQTVSHPADLGQLSDAQVWKELTDSKRELEKQLGVRCWYLAYPNGKFDSRSEVLAQKAGYVMAFSEVTKPAEASPSLFAVNRYVHTRWKRAWTEVNGSNRRFK